MTQACLGGWCKLRQNCPHYHAAMRLWPAERLCDKGRDGYSSVHFVCMPDRAETRFVAVAQEMAA